MLRFGVTSLFRPKLTSLLGAYLALAHSRPPARRPYIVAKPVRKRSPQGIAWGGFGGVSSVLQDRRLFHPLGSDRPLVTRTGGPVRVIPKPRALQRDKIAVPAALGFAGAPRVMICARREVRKQVLHAKGIAGGSGMRPPRYNWTSQYTCR